MKNVYKLTKGEARSWDRCLGDSRREATDDDRITVEDVLMRANGALICYPRLRTLARGARRNGQGYLVMMFTDGDEADVYTCITRRARKVHVCGVCAETIQPLQRYTLTTLIYDGQVIAVKRCARCETLYRHLLDMADTQNEWPAVDLSCGDSYEDVFDEPPPLEIEALAFALPGEVVL